MTRSELIDRYLLHARLYYKRADGTPTRHAANLELGLRPLRSSEPASAMTLHDLIEYREALIARGLLRKTINQWCGWVKALFRWAAREQLLPASIAAELALLDPLRFGRSPARESSPPQLVTRERVAAVLPYLPSMVSRMVQVQWLAGMRVGEVVSMRGSELVELDGYVIYAPSHHKTAHHERRRRIVLPNAARALIDLDEAGYQFINTRGNAFTRNTYGSAIRKACRAIGDSVWSPGQLRRSAATYARRLIGKEGVQRLLGHASGDTTEIYLDLEVIDAIAFVQALDQQKWSLSTRFELTRAS